MTQPPEVVLDARWLRSGIGRYIITLLQQLKQQLPQVSLTCITMPEHIETIAPYCDRVIPLACDIYTLREQLALPAIRRGASVFCSPHYNVPLLRRGKIVATVHDITHLIFPAYGSRMSSRLYAEPMLRMACARVSHIVTPSNYTRQTLIDRLHADPEKISAIHCAVDEVFQLRDKKEAAERVEQAHGIDEPYMLYVGSTAPHKNLSGLLEAYERLRVRKRDTPALVLVLPERRSAAQADQRLGSLMNGPGIHRLHAVSDRSLADLYSAACMTLLPSFEEGFGLPAVESMACGTPVLCSNAASIPEIAGEAAGYFSPHSIEEMSCAIEELLNSTSMQLRLTALGLERAAMYSVERAATGYASVLSSVIAGQAWEGAAPRRERSWNNSR
jgi:glycosyltransferase involved in cell wall biosynthesis